jgi:hypothetical protein
MSLGKPFHRTYRRIKPGQQSGFYGWAYLADPQYAKNPEHYVRAFTLIQNDLQSIFEYIEPSDEGRAAYSYRIHALFMRACIEIEANFKAILEENTFNQQTRWLKMNDYRRVDVTHHLSSYEVILPIWNSTSPTFKPFEPWRAWRGLEKPKDIDLSLPWYQAYNASKHDRQDEFKKANFENLVMAVAGLLVLISSQFRNRDFSVGGSFKGMQGREYEYRLPIEAATGELFQIRYPDDWLEEELYDCDWMVLKNQKDRFEKINFDAIPC